MPRPRPDRQQHLALILAGAVLTAIVCGGCSSKNVGYSRKSSGGYSTPTQAPYVIKNVTYYPIADATGFREQGIASWYGEYFHGRQTSNGETYDMYDMTAAHKILPMNTMLRVKNLENGREITVRVNDRGPFIDGRVIDLSYTAARKLGMVGPGTAPVEIAALPATLVRPESPSARPAEPAIASTATASRLPANPPQQPKARPVEVATISPQTSPAQAETSNALQPASPAPPQSASQAVRNRSHPAAPRQEVDTTLYYVQVGRFSAMDQAQRLKQRFTDAGHAAVIDTALDGDRQSFHVHVYAGREMASAKKAEAELLARGYTEASVVIR